MNKIPLFLVCLLVGAVGLLIDPSAYRSFSAPKHAVLISIIPLIGICAVLATKQVRVGVLPLLLLARIGWLALTNPDWVLHSGNDSFYLHFSLLLLVIVVQQFSKEQILNALCVTVFVVGIIQVSVGIWQLLAYVPNPSVPIKTPFVGLLGTPNGLGILLVLSVVSGVHIGLDAKKAWARYLIAAGVLFLMLGVLLSESRGAWLSFVGILSVYSMVILLKTEFLKRFLLRIDKTPIIIGSLLLILGLITSLYLINPESSKGRLMIWEITSEMIKEEPFLGVGHGNYSVEYLNYQAEYFSKPENQQREYKAANIKQAHNEFLQAIAEGGVLGGLLFGSIWLLPLWIGIKRFGHRSFEIMTPVAIVVAICLHSLVDSPLHVLPISVIGYSFLVLLPLPEITFKLTSKTKWVTVLVLCGYSLFVGLRTLRTYPGYRIWKQGIELASNQEWPSSIVAYNEAMNRFKQKGELSFHLGSALVFDGQYSKGMYYLNSAKRDFNDKNIYLSEALAHIQLKDFEKAEELTLKTLAMFPSHLAPHLLLGEIYFELGQEEKSKKSLLKCIREDILVTSEETKQISKDAKDYWKSVYGALPVN